LADCYANNADQAHHTTVKFFPDTANKQWFMDLSLNVKVVISMLLVAGVSEC
jgi:Tfp pilus assembly ATPase PilU